MINHQFSQKAFLGLFIGAVGGLLFGIFIGNPMLGMLLGAAVGFRIPLGKRRTHIDLRKPDIKWLYFSIPVILALFLIIYYFRPWFHGFLMGFYVVPSIVFLFLFGVSFAVAMVKGWKGPAYILGALMVLSFLILLFNQVLVQKSIVGKETYNKIEALPDSGNLRLLPQAIAHRYLEDSLQKSREKVGGLDIISINGTLAWTSPRIPDGGLLYLTQPVNGLLIADATSTDRETRVLSYEMAVGEGIGITDNIEWQIYKDQFFIDIDDIYYIVEGEDVYAIASVIGYEFRFPVMVPIWKGVYIIDGEGNKQWVERDRIGDVPLLEGQKVYPESLARLYVDSYKYNLGWINEQFLHKDQIEISDVYGQQNRQPFLMDTEDGLQWVIATEPYGKSYGVFKIFMVDAFDGRIQMLELDEDQTLTGPVRVVSYVKKKFPTIDWATARVVEPRPYIIDGNLSWMLSVTPSDFAGVSYTVLVDAANNEVLAFEDDDELKTYLEDGLVVDEILAPEVAGSDSNDVYLDEKTKEVLRKKISDIEDELADLKRLLDE